VRRRVKVADPDEIVRVVVPPAPIPPSWGRAVAPYRPALPSTPPAAAAAPASKAAAARAADENAGAANGQTAVVAAAAAAAAGAAGPCDYRETASMARFDYASLPLMGKYLAVLISQGWEAACGDDPAAATAALSKLPVPRMAPTGFVFIWVPKHFVHSVVKQVRLWAGGKSVQKWLFYGSRCRNREVRAWCVCMLGVLMDLRTVAGWQSGSQHAC
jgi:hypothetical protein